MTVHQINYLSAAGKFSDDGQFNTNTLLYANTGETPWGGNYGNVLGNPTSETIDAISEFEVDVTRFPAGQGLVAQIG